LKAVAQPHLPMALLAQRHREWSCLLVLPPQTSNVTRGSLPCSFRSPAPKMQTSPDSWQPEGASLERCCSASSAHSTAPQKHREWGCLLVLPPKIQTYLRGSLSGSFRSPAPKMRTSPDSTQPEGASLESCCSTSSAHGTAHTEAERLGLLARLATSNFKRILGGACRAPPPALLRKCERLQIAGSQKGQAWKGVAQRYLTVALLAKRHKHWGYLLVLQPQTSNVS